MTKEETTVFKGIAMLLMLIHHLFMDNATLEVMNVHSLCSRNILLIIASTSKICVAIFIFVSSYGIASSNSSKDTSYISKRIIKILLPFMFVYGLAAVAAIFSGQWGVIYGNNFQSIIYYCFLDIFGLANLFGTPTLNGTWWYMSYALFLPIIIIFLLAIYKRIGAIGVIIVGIYIPACFGVEEVSPYRWWMLTIIVGIIAARNNLFEKIKVLKHCNVFYAIVILLIIPIAYVRYGIGGYWILDAMLVIPFALIAIIFNRIPIIKSFFYEIGLNSYYMFLTHSFIFYYYFRKFIYSWKYDVVILSALLICSYLLAKSITLLYKFLNISKFEQFLLSKITECGH